MEVQTFLASVRVVAVPRISTSSRNLGYNNGVFPSNFGVLVLPRRGICVGRAIGAGGSGVGNTAGSCGRATRDGGQACQRSGVDGNELDCSPKRVASVGKAGRGV